MPLAMAAIGLLIIHLILQFRLYVLGQPSMLVLGSFDVDLTYWFNLNLEKRFGALFGTTLILISSGLMAFAAYRACPKKVKTAGWLMLSGILLFMAFDEFFSLHERAGAVAGLESEGYGTQVLPIWVQAMAVVVAVLSIPMGIFWLTLPKGLRIRTFISAVVFLGGAVGIEIVSSAFIMYQGNENFGYNFLVAIEEGMEMLGILILIDAMLLYLMGVEEKNQSPEQSEQTKPATANA